MVIWHFLISEAMNVSFKYNICCDLQVFIVDFFFSMKVYLGSVSLSHFWVIPFIRDRHSGVIPLIYSLYYYMNNLNFLKSGKMFMLDPVYKNVSVDLKNWHVNISLFIC